MKDEDFVLGDKRIAAAVIGALILAGVLWTFQSGTPAPDPSFETLQYAEEALRSTIARARSVALTGIALNLGFFLYFVVFGIRVIQSQTSPPPRWRVPWRVKVKRGRSASLIGWGCLLIGVIFLIRAGSLAGTLRALS